MDTTEIIVTLAGLALAGFVIWYFFFSTRQTEVVRNDGQSWDVV